MLHSWVLHLLVSDLEPEHPPVEVQLLYLVFIPPPQKTEHFVHPPHSVHPAPD